MSSCEVVRINRLNHAVRRFNTYPIFEPSKPSEASEPSWLGSGSDADSGASFDAGFVTRILLCSRGTNGSGCCRSVRRAESIVADASASVSPTDNAASKRSCTMSSLPWSNARHDAQYSFWLRSPSTASATDRTKPSRLVGRTTTGAGSGTDGLRGASVSTACDGRSATVVPVHEYGLPVTGCNDGGTIT